MTTWRLGRRPELDGLRGIAIALVLVCHLTTGVLHGLGTIGVNVFFTLSGFLITALMLEERDTAGRVDVVAFYGRRARRLLPALLAMVGVVTAVGVVVDGYTNGPILAGTLTYSSNWVIAVNPAAGDPAVGGALGHTWSLAVEEQFYLLWPLAFYGLSRLPGRWQARSLAVAVAVTAALPIVLKGADDYGRIYYGSDTRAMPVLVGCLLAWAMHRERAATATRPAVAGVAVALVVATIWLPWSTRFYLGSQLVAVLTACAIWAAVRGPAVDWLRWSPMALLGRRSYGLYLWHWPVIFLASRWVDGWALVAVALPMSLALTALSWRWVESPFLSRNANSAAPQPFGGRAALMGEAA